MSYWPILHFASSISKSPDGSFTYSPHREERIHCSTVARRTHEPALTLKRDVISNCFRSQDAKEAEEAQPFHLWRSRSCSLRVSAALRADLSRSSLVRPVLGWLPSFFQFFSGMSTP
jgi:hypothetical protein